MGQKEKNIVSTISIHGEIDGEIREIYTIKAIDLGGGKYVVSSFIPGDWFANQEKELDVSIKSLFGLNVGETFTLQDIEKRVENLENWGFVNARGISLNGDMVVALHDIPVEIHTQQCWWWFSSGKLIVSWIFDIKYATLEKIISFELNVGGEWIVIASIFRSELEEKDIDVMTVAGKQFHVPFPTVPNTFIGRISVSNVGASNEVDVNQD